jgi:hypothetical protein
VAGHQRTVDTLAGGGRVDTPTGGGQAGATLRMGINAYAMGEGRIRREPQRGGREDASTEGGGRHRHRKRAAAKAAAVTESRRRRRRWPLLYDT